MMSRTCRLLSKTKNSYFLNEKNLMHDDFNTESASFPFLTLKQKVVCVDLLKESTKANDTTLTATRFIHFSFHFVVA